MEEGDVPALEDMSAYVQQLKQKPIATTLAPQKQPTRHVDSSLLDLELPEESRVNRTLLVCGNGESSNVSSTVGSSSSSSQPSKEQRGAKPAAATSFAGMKKGFLFGGGSTSKGARKTKESSANQSHNSAGSTRGEPSNLSTSSQEPTLLKAGSKSGAEVSDGLRLKEVQEEMRKSQPLLTPQDWITPDLLRKIEESPVLSKAFQDPSLSRVMAEFQQNPQAALQAAQHKPELLQFLKEFSSLMGEHLSSFPSAKSGSKPKQNELISETIPPEEEAHLKKLLSKPEVQSAMKDPEVQRLIELLRSDPEEAQKLLWANRDPNFHSKVTLLLENQVLAIQTY